MPCYDLVLVIEFTVGPHRGTLSTPNFPDLTGGFHFLEHCESPRSERISRTTRVLQKRRYIFVGFVLQITMIYHSVPTTTQLTSHVHKFPLTHEISLGHLSFFSGHPDRDLTRCFPQTHRWGRTSLFMIRLSFATRLLQSTSHDRGPTRSLLFRGWI